jgi:zinc transporter
MYVLTVVATVLLPPSLITGLLGINVGGIPGSDSSWGFGIVIFLLVILALVEIAVLRRLRWI